MTSLIQTVQQLPMSNMSQKQVKIQNQTPPSKSQQPKRKFLPIKSINDDEMFKFQEAEERFGTKSGKPAEK